jgi:GMP synthase-like glutamine amidotransferase
MISFIDCYIQSPVNHCVNQFIQRSNIPCTYHAPSQFGTNSLKSEKTPNAYVILGSAAHVTEMKSWQANLIEFIIPKLESGIPVLGICYGHQLIAHHYGSNVAYTDIEKTHYKEARKISISKDFWNYKSNHTFSLAYAHSQIVTKLSDQFEQLADSHRFQNEIIKHKSLPFYGLQAHPEASRDFLINDANIKINQDKILNNGHEFIMNFYNDAISL